MPCYTVITNTIEFKAENVNFLVKAIKAMGGTNIQIYETGISFIHKGRESIRISFKNSTISSQLDKNDLMTFSNSLKRAYSEQVIDEVARKNKWIQKKLGENRYQLQRF